MLLSIVTLGVPKPAAAPVKPRGPESPGSPFGPVAPVSPVAPFAPVAPFILQTNTHLATLAAPSTAHV